MLLTTNEVAHVLRLDVRTIKRHLEAGVIPGKKIGKVWRVRSADLSDMTGIPIADIERQAQEVEYVD